MFESKVAKSNAESSLHSSNRLARQRFSNQTQRPGTGSWTQPSEGRLGGPSAPALPINPTRLASWDFRNIPAFPPGPSNRRERPQHLVEFPLPGILQAKLDIGPTSSPLEVEADRVADRVMQSPTPDASITRAPTLVSRKCSACDAEDKELHKTTDGTSAIRGEAPAVVHDVLRSPGQSLDAVTQSFFQSRLGFDFRDVRIHHDGAASTAAESIGARAFTVGREIVFGKDEFAPASSKGRHLIAHELAHVLQSDSGVIRRQDHTGGNAADPDSLAAEIISLLHTTDEVAGMQTSDAIQKLSGLGWTQLLAVLRAIRARSANDLPIIQEGAPLLISVAAETVFLEGTPSPEPEALARYRTRVQQLPAQEQTLVTTTYPAALVPADPALPAAGLVPPAGAPAGIPAPLLATLYHSYARRQAGLPGSDTYLANAFWGGRPVDFSQALTQMGSALDVVRRVYARWTGAGIPWSFVEAIYSVWSGSSDGFDFVCSDRSGLNDALNGASTLCQDHVGGLYHWWVEGSTPCWREMITGSPGMHVCTGGNRTTVHIDPHQVVSGKWPVTGYCSYDITGSVVDHFKDLGWW